MVSTLKVTKIQIPNSDSDVISLDASSGNITIPKNVTFSGTVSGATSTFTSSEITITASTKTTPADDQLSNITWPKKPE